MTEPSSFEEAILLRVVDRLLLTEQQIATSLAMVNSLTKTVTDLRSEMSALSDELEEMRKLSTAAMQSFEEMRLPLQNLLDLKQKLTGGWLVVVAVFMALSYLLQPVLEHLYHWRLTEK